MPLLGRYVRHVLADWSRIFLLASIGVTALLMLVGVVREARSKDLAPEMIVQLLPFLVPEALRFTLPAMGLLAAAMTFGRMSATGEVIALKAAGINVVRAVILPVLAVAFLLSRAAVWLNDLAVTWGREGVQRVGIEAVEEVIYDKLKSDGHFSTDAFSIAVERIEGRRLLGTTVILTAGDGRTVNIAATEAVLDYHSKVQELSITILDGTASSGNVKYVFDQEERRIPFGLFRPDRSPSMIPLSELPLALDERREELNQFREELAAELALGLVTGDHLALQAERWTGQLDSIAIRKQNIARLKTEPYRRWSNGFSVLVFMMVGIPLAILNRRADTMTNFGLVFLPIMTVYYPLMALTVNQAKDGTFPGWSVWAGNLLLAVWGSWLMYRVWRY